MTNLWQACCKLKLLSGAGSHKTKLFVIGKSVKPRAFKNVKVFPVIYWSNKRAWMTQHLMNDWFENHFVPEARRHLSGNGFPADAKILLILDNCTAHLSPEILVKDNVSVLFIPPNCTSLIQPMDMGIEVPVQIRIPERNAQLSKRRGNTSKLVEILQFENGNVECS
ncbi:Jerky [Araneus ventricosus]|uniref:Jerky n=1 Tax=Araneus ventricosus TaxID=182803 RepID=A0A4Y2KKW4_ARAVE|nr:Jerky [Araneus ventricosus]